MNMFLSGRRVKIIVSSLLCTFALSFAASAVAAPLTLKLAHQWTAPHDGKGDDRSLLAVKFAKKVEQLSNGSVKIQVYPGNSLIGPRQQWTALQSGALDMALIVPSYFAGQVSELRGLNMAGLVDSHDAAYSFDNGPGGKVMRDLFENHGVRLIASTWGPESIAFRNKKVRTPSGLEGLRMRGTGPAVEKIFAKAGASIVSMPSSDLYTALQTGAIDGALTTFTSMHTYRLYEHLKYVMESPSEGGMVYSMVPLVMSDRTWKKMDSQQQKAVTDAATALKPWIRKRTKMEASRNIKFFKDQGLTVYKLTDSQFQAWTDIEKSIVDSYAQISKQAAEMVKYGRIANKQAAH